MKPSKLTITDLELCQTEDQSWTVLHKDLDAHYRSTHGAKAESDWVFIKGTRLSEQDTWTIGELGFGLGTNLSTALALHGSRKQQTPLHYIGIDHQPIPPSIVEQTLSPSQYRDWLLDLLQQIDRGQTIAVVEPTEHIRLELHATNLASSTLPTNWASAFFHDPFGPKSNPEAWTPEAFATIRNCMTKQGILATYGAAGHARRAMANAGFWLASTKGFGRKREMTIASPSQQSLTHGTLIKKYPPFMELKP